MHLDLFHGKWHGMKAIVVELSWIQPLYCLQHTVDFPSENPSELDLLKNSVEDRYFGSRKDLIRIRYKILFNHRSNILIKSSKIPILDFNITRICEVYLIMTGSF